MYFRDSMLGGVLYLNKEEEKKSFSTILDLNNNAGVLYLNSNSDVLYLNHNGEVLYLSMHTSTVLYLSVHRAMYCITTLMAMQCVISGSVPAGPLGHHEC